MAIQQDHEKYSQFNPQGLMRTTFFNFTDAGINTYTSGPNQQPTDWLDLQNVLPSTTGGFRIRWGVNTMFTASTVIHPVRAWAYNVAQDASNPTQTGTRDMVISTDNQNFYNLNVTTTGTATGPLENNLVFSVYTGLPSNTTSFAAAGNVTAVVSRGYFYYANGVASPMKVNFTYFSIDTNWNWGIEAPAAYTSTSGNVNAAASTITAFGGTGQNYTSPTVTISGGGGTGAAAAAVVKNGAITGFTISAPGTGYTSTPSVEISDSSGTGAEAVAVYNDFGVIVAVLPAGPIVLNAGRTYTYAWQNSITGHTSDIASGIQAGTEFLQYTGNAATVLGPAVGIIGNVPAGVGFSQIYVTINPVTPIDAQIDTLVLMATSDGGSLDQLYGVALLPITSTTPGTINYTDTLPDTYTDGPSSVTAASIAVDGVFGRFFYGSGDGYFESISSSTPPLFTQSFDSLMFNPHPTNTADGTPIILANYPVRNGNQQQPFQNASLTQYGTFSTNVACQGNGIQIGVNSTSYYNFQMVLTGNFIVAAAGNITFTPYIDAAFMIGLGPSGTNTPTYVSGPQQFNGYSHTPFENYVCLAGLQNYQDWHNSYILPFVLDFPAAGVYPFEICYATFNHTEREMCLLANSAVIPPGSASGSAYTGLTLLNANLWVDTDSYGNTYGIINNDLPPANLLYPTLHQGRLFATDGKSLFFSKSLAEVTTSTGLITSKWEEAWPGTNSIPIGLDNELINGLRSSGQSLHIATAKSLYELQGDSPSNFNIPSSLFQETGLLSNDCWATVYAQGKPSGYVWVTPDLKVLYSDFNTYDNIGQPVYTILNTWVNSYNAYAKVNSFTYGPYNLVVITFQSSTQGTEFLIFETTMQKWYRWTTPSTVVSGQQGPLASFVYQHPETGYRGLFFWQNNSANSYLCLFDPALITDTIPNTPALSIPYNLQTSWTSLNDPLSTKVLNEIEVMTGDAGMGVTVYGATKSYDFSNYSLLKTGPLVTNPLGSFKFFCADVPTVARFYSFQFASTYSGFQPTSSADVLDRFVVENMPMVRF